MSTTLSSSRDGIPSIIGHRGACGHAPENTLSSIKMAHELGAGWVEFDVKITADDAVIVFHDDTLERTSDGVGNVADFSLAEIQGLDGGSWFSDAFAGETIPTLIDTIKLLDNLSLGANVEIKPVEGLEVETAEVVCRVIADYWPKHKPWPLISSFKDDCLAVAREQLPECDRALLVLEVPDDWEQRARSGGCNAVHVWFEPLAQNQVADILGAGYPVRCFTVNELETAKRLFQWGVESVITNFPEKMS